MNLRFEQAKLTISLKEKHALKLFKVHTVLPELLCSCGAYKCTSQGKHPIYKDWKDGPFLEKIEQFVIRLGEINYFSNLAIKTGNGIVVVDFDSEESYLIFLNTYPHLRKTLTVKTGKGFHLYFNSKSRISNRVRFLKDVDLRGDGGYVIAPGSCHISGKDYYWIDSTANILEFPDDIITKLPKEDKSTTNELRTNVLEGGRNDFLFKETIKLIDLKVSTELLHSLVNQLNENICSPPLDQDEILQIIKSAQATVQKKELEPTFPVISMFGVLGTIVSKIAPHTEANPIAIYSQLITIIGSYFGRIASSHVSGDKHYSNLMTLIVGDSALARKGTSLGAAIAILEEIIPDFVKNNIKSGATSAEGIIFHNRDPIYEIKDKKGKLEKICVDAGVTDKRLMIIETEFGSVLISMKREGNKLSTTIRDAYDSKNLSTLSKNNSVKSTNPHISIIAHITIEELKHLLNVVDVFNGFGNRFMYIYTKADKILPEAPSIKDLNLKGELSLLSEAIHFWDKDLNVLSNHRVKFSIEAQKLWNETYTSFMKTPESGIIGTLLNRNLVHVKKIALIFAMLDKQLLIQKEHLEAALKIGEYSKESIRFIFKDSASRLSNKHKKVLSLLESSIKNQATRTEISKEALKKNSTKKEIEQIKSDLLNGDLITVNQTPDAEFWELK